MDKKYYKYIVIIVILLVILLIVNILPGKDNKKTAKKNSSFESYIYSEGEVPSDFTLGYEENGVSTYTKEGTFLDYSGTVVLSRDNLSNSTVSNSFKMVLDNINSESDLDTAIQKYIHEFQEYLNYNEAFSQSLIPMSTNEIDYEKSVLASVMSKDAILRFYAATNPKLYYIDVYVENDVYYLETSYIGELKETQNSQPPKGVNGQ